MPCFFLGPGYPIARAKKKRTRTIVVDSLDHLEVQLNSMKNATLPTMAMIMCMHMRKLWVRSLAERSI
jgi:hypothetical protein